MSSKKFVANYTNIINNNMLPIIENYFIDLASIQQPLFNIDKYEREIYKNGPKLQRYFFASGMGYLTFHCYFFILDDYIICEICIFDFIMQSIDFTNSNKKCYNAWFKIDITEKYSTDEEKILNIIFPKMCNISSDQEVLKKLNERKFENFFN